MNEGELRALKELYNNALSSLKKHYDSLSALVDHQKQYNEQLDSEEFDKAFEKYEAGYKLGIEESAKEIAGYRLGIAEVEEELKSLQEQYNRQSALVDHLIKEATKTPEEEEAEEEEFEKWYKEMELKQSALVEPERNIEALNKQYNKQSALVDEDISKYAESEADYDHIIALRKIYDNFSPEERKEHFILGDE